MALWPCVSRCRQCCHAVHTRAPSPSSRPFILANSAAVDAWTLLVRPYHPFVTNGIVPTVLTWEPMIASSVDAHAYARLAPLLSDPVEQEAKPRLGGRMTA